MNINKRIGAIGESLACQYLKNNGYEIVEKNFNSNYGEIDIIAKKSAVLVFVEVKTRTNKKFGEPAEAVNLTKQKHILKTAKYYLYSTKQENTCTRFDILEILLKNGKIEFNHIKQIF